MLQHRKKCFSAIQPHVDRQAYSVSGRYANGVLSSTAADSGP